MPALPFQNPHTGEVKDIYVSIHETDKTKFQVQIDENGVAWKRIIENPNMAVDSKWDAFSERDFINKSATKRGSVGDLWQKSQELSEQREAKAGVDGVKEKFYADYQKKHRGIKHEQQRKEETKKALKDAGLSGLIS